MIMNDLVVGGKNQYDIPSLFFHEESIGAIFSLVRPSSKKLGMDIRCHGYQKNYKNIFFQNKLYVFDHFSNNTILLKLQMVEVFGPT